MKLVAFSPDDGSDERRVGALTADGLRDLTDELDGPSPDVGHLARLGIERLSVLRGGPLLDPARVRLRAPLIGSGKIIAVGLNYHSHCREQGITAPAYPLLFAILPNAIADPGAPIFRPRATEQLDVECELAVLIGRRLKAASRAEAAAAIFGYTILNDVSARDLQREDRQWLRAKSSDSFAPIGPLVVTADELTLPLRLRTSVNGETWQDESTDDMIFDVAALIAFTSQTLTLEPGDLLVTGTPAGVGHYHSPPRYLSGGDAVRCEIGGIGALENVVVDEEPRNADHDAAAGIGLMARAR